MVRTVTIRLFAQAREAAGASEIHRPIPEGGIAVPTLLRELERDFPRLRRVLTISRFVRNGEYLPGPVGHLSRGDELAIHPPYSGG
jgi:molybdopterin converting factor small subunit